MPDALQMPPWADPGNGLNAAFGPANNLEALPQSSWLSAAFSAGGLPQQHIGEGHPAVAPGQDSGPLHRSVSAGLAAHCPAACRCESSQDTCCCLCRSQPSEVGQPHTQHRPQGLASPPLGSALGSRTGSGSSLDALPQAKLPTPAGRALQPARMPLQDVLRKFALLEQNLHREQLGLCWGLLYHFSGLSRLCTMGWWAW